MLRTTPQERLALGVTALLIAAGTGVRVVGGVAPAAVEWAESADTQKGVEVSALREAVDVAAAERRRASEPLGRGERIDPNRADAVELERLPRVGPSLAGRIVAHRERNGPFRSLADLDAVPGIGPAVLDGIAPLVALPAAPAGDRAESRISINRASLEELQALPGIGPALAARIVEWRRENGAFRTPEALEEVPGIGPALRARIEPRIRFDP